ncbi:MULTISPECIES: DUF4145 domain-containing protein [unclassified Psychrobacter]|uniref:DUF4145 domain-containing protein n=1 Tax=unclassified Psychrobacter TaxID=196806 RepID=UPI00071E7426|nr:MULTISPECIES: hypothetical protein [unclassified Psychrobacter]OLF35656.1 hypothetical protein BTV98_12625 [Psychrobacter sp. Cmf 22.2]
MSPDVFIDDFKLTETTEELHAILGRCIIIATRFDNLCDHGSKFIKIRKAREKLSDDEFAALTTSLFDKYPNLNNNINFLPVGQTAQDALHAAREARNEVAHSLSIGMIGCLDIRIDESAFKQQVPSLITRIATGDYLISTIISLLNKEAVPNYTENDYKRKITEE